LYEILKSKKKNKKKDELRVKKRIAYSIYDKQIKKENVNTVISHFFWRATKYEMSLFVARQKKSKI
jgi:hypothetical protein